MWCMNIGEQYTVHAFQVHRGLLLLSITRYYYVLLTIKPLVKPSGIRLCSGTVYHAGDLSPDVAYNGQGYRIFHIQEHIDNQRCPMYLLLFRFRVSACASQFVEEQAKGVFVKTLRNMQARTTLFYYIINSVIIVFTGVKPRHSNVLFSFCSTFFFVCFTREQFFFFSRSVAPYLF